MKVKVLKSIGSMPEGTILDSDSHGIFVYGSVTEDFSDKKSSITQEAINFTEDYVTSEPELFEVIKEVPEKSYKEYVGELLEKVSGESMGVKEEAEKMLATVKAAQETFKKESDYIKQRDYFNLLNGMEIALSSILDSVRK